MTRLNTVAIGVLAIVLVTALGIIAGCGLSAGKTDTPKPDTVVIQEKTQPVPSKTSTGEPSSLPKAEKNRETIFDRIVHIEPELIQDIPQVPRWCDQLDLKKQRVNIGDCELYVEEEGKGIPIVLINGGPGGTHHCFHPYFSRAKDFARIIYYDQRGCGLSDYKQGRGYTIKQAVDDLDNLRTILKIGKWVVIGWSYGGFLAQCYTTKYPENTAGLVLVGSAIPMPIFLKPTRQYNFMSPEEQKKIAECYIKFYNAPRGYNSTYNAWLNGDWKRQNYYKPPPERLAQMVRYEWVHDPVFCQSICSNMTKIDLTKSFDTCPIPTIILEGKWDLTWNTDKPEKLHQNHPKSKLIMFDYSGHGPFEDEPERFFQVLKDFIKDLPKVSDSNLSEWKESLRKRQESTEYILRKSGWGSKSNKKWPRNIQPNGLHNYLILGTFLRLVALYMI